MACVILHQVNGQFLSAPTELSEGLRDFRPTATHGVGSFHPSTIWTLEVLDERFFDDNALKQCGQALIPRPVAGFGFISIHLDKVQFVTRG